MLMPSKGMAGLAAMLIFVALILFYIPVTRWFLLFSIPVGGIVALILALWHKRRPVEDPHQNKHPLGLE